MDHLKFSCIHDLKVKKNIKHLKKLVRNNLRALAISYCESRNLKKQKSLKMKKKKQKRNRRH